MKSNKCVVITDIDNTLFDWFALWHGSFKPLLDEVAERSGIPRDVLIGDIKPNPDVLQATIEKVGAKAIDCVYVGDSLNKDVLMAQQAGVADVHFECGVSHGLEEYDLLWSVTHWPAEQVEAEKKSSTMVRPTYVIDATYSDLLTLFNFTRYTGALAPPPSEQRIPRVIDVWKKIVIP